MPVLLRDLRCQCGCNSQVDYAASSPFPEFLLRNSRIAARAGIISWRRASFRMSHLSLPTPRPVTHSQTRSYMPTSFALFVTLGADGSVGYARDPGCGSTGFLLLGPPMMPCNYVR